MQTTFRNRFCIDNYSIFSYTIFFPISFFALCKIVIVSS